MPQDAFLMLEGEFVVHDLMNVSNGNLTVVAGLQQRFKNGGLSGGVSMCQRR